jgi:predicted deacetylase
MARYLIRFDDLCPTINHSKWSAVERVVDKYNVRPIVAIVPDNQDPALVADKEDGKFWARMRGLGARGWTIGLHGYQHLCTNNGRSLVPIHEETEFAGLPESTQRQKIGRGLGILAEHGLKPKLWVAPRHSFDSVTNSVLKLLGIHCISDGFALYPYAEDGLLWIPQQMWRFRKMPFGVWTITLHPNSMTASDVADMDSFLAANRSRFTDFPEIRSTFAARTKSMLDIAFQKYCHSYMKRRRSRESKLFAGLVVEVNGNCGKL